MKCNICGSSKFAEKNGVKNRQCTSCFSLERTRLLWMYLQSHKITRKSRILHIAPDRGIYRALSKIVDKQNYIAADIHPETYAFVDSCQKIDLCALDDEPSFQYDFIVHMHVLEHVRCNIGYTLYHLHRMLKKRGRHICVIPFDDGDYDECFGEIGDKERTRRFGQWDHVRRFGNRDADKHLGKLLKLPNPFDATKNFSKEALQGANIPEHYWQGYHISTVLVLNRKDMKLL